MKWKRSLLAISLLVLLLPGLSCARKQITVTDLPPGVSETEVKNWYVATGAMLVIAEGTEDATDFVISLRESGVFSDDAAYVSTLKALKRVATTGKSASSFLEQVPNTFGLDTTGKLVEFADIAVIEVQAAIDQGTIGIGDDASRARFKRILGLVQIALRTLRTILPVITSETAVGSLEVAYG